MKIEVQAAPASSPFERAGFAAALALLFIYFLLRNAGVFPMVFADEWLYSMSARLQPLAQSTLPSFLYLALYQQTSMCGPGFLECARVLNALLFVAAGPFLYLLARRVSGPRVAAAVALLCLLGPINTYTVYFMPETMYFFGFCVLSWLALAGRGLPPLAYGALAGAMLGLLALVKVHAWFLLPPMLAFMAFLCATERGRNWPLRLALMLAATVTAMVLVKSALGYLLAGKAGLALLGSFYGDHASHSGTGRSLTRLVMPALASLRGHALGLVLLMALPLAALLWQLVSRAAREQAGRELRVLQAYAVLMLGAVLGMTVLYTATIAEFGPLEGWRLHMRYYDFVFPLLLIVAVAQLSTPASALGTAGRAVAAAGVLAALWYAHASLLPRYATSFVDSPELQAITEDPAVRLAAVLLQTALLAAWAWRPRVGAGLLLAVALPLSVWNSESLARSVFARQRTADSYDRAGLLAKNLLPAEDKAQLTVAGDGPGLLRALFHIDTPGADFIELAPGAPLAANEIPQRRRWLLVVGERQLPAEVATVARAPDFALIRVPPLSSDMRRIEFAAPLKSGLLLKAEGLSRPEPWGAWSDGGQVRLEFAAPLPKSVRLLLTANAFGPNAEHDFVIAVGAQRQAFRLPGKPQQRVFEFETDGNATVVTIEVPQPTAPADIGAGQDFRKLGIAIASVEFGSK